MPRTGHSGAKGSGYRRILWPTDFSPLAETVLPHAQRLTVEAGAELIVLHVLSPSAFSFPPETATAAWVRQAREQRAAARAELRRITAQVKGKAPQFRVHGVLVDGVPFDQIVRSARRIKCDLIVLATHGRTGLRHVVMGSVAENVVRHAPCPALTVRPPGVPLPR